MSTYFARSVFNFGRAYCFGDHVFLILYVFNVVIPLVTEKDSSGLYNTFAELGAGVQSDAVGQQAAQIIQL